VTDIIISEESKPEEADRRFFEEHPEHETYMRPLSDAELSGRRPKDDENWVAVWQHAPGHFVRRQIFLREPPSPLEAETLSREAFGLVPKFEPRWSKDNPADLWSLNSEEDNELIAQGYLPEKDVKMLQALGIIGFDKDGIEQTAKSKQMRLRKGDNPFEAYGLKLHPEREQVPGLDVGIEVFDAGDDITLPPPRGWLLGTSFARKFMSSILADGGTGKTALRYAQLVALATGNPITGEHVFQRCRVLIVSLEDDRDELRRRIEAVLRHYRIARSELKGQMYYITPGADAGKIMRQNKVGQIVRDRLAVTIEAIVDTRGIDIVAVDPFVKSHSVEENNNSAIDQVVQVLTDLATKYNIAVDCPHHVSKGSADPGNANRGRGASAMKDAARLVYTLTRMNETEAEAFGIDEEERISLLRVDSAKVNLTKGTAASKWFHLVPVLIGNRTELYPSGDEIQTVEPWTPPSAWEDFDENLQNRILMAIDAGLPDGNRYTDKPNAGEREAWKVVVEHAPRKTEGQARQVIKTWVKLKVLTSRDYPNPKTRKDVKGLYLDPEKRPK
jgi:hypothetical protein